MVDRFSIATVKTGSGRIGICRLPGLFGDLGSDLSIIREWGPDIVVSMTEMAEMEQCGSRNLAELLADAGIEWVHLPIRDFGGPDGGSEAAWPGLSGRLHKLIYDGGGVLLHCRGGHGRSGMIALRILVERGEEPNQALTRLRAARPGAVETDQQLAWALSG